MNYLYKIAFKCAVTCIENGYPQSVWISPIPEKDKDLIWNKAKKYVDKVKALKQEPSLF